MRKTQIFSRVLGLAPALMLAVSLGAPAQEAASVPRLVPSVPGQGVAPEGRSLSPAARRADREIEALREDLIWRSKEELLDLATEREAFLRESEAQRVTDRQAWSMELTLRALGEGRSGIDDVWDLFPAAMRLPHSDGVILGGRNWMRLEGFSRQAALISFAGMTRGSCLALSKLLLTPDAVSLSGWRLARIEFGARALEGADFERARGALAPSLLELLKWRQAKGEAAQAAARALAEAPFDPCGQMLETDALRLLWLRVEPLKPRQSWASVYRDLPPLATESIKF